MAKRKRRNHSPIFKSRVVVAALKGDKTLAELAQCYDVHPNQITDWKSQLLERAAQVFGETSTMTPVPDIKTLHANIGEVTSPSTTNDAHTSRLTGRYPMRFTSTTCRRKESRPDQPGAPHIQADFLSK